MEVFHARTTQEGVVPAVRSCICSGAEGGDGGRAPSSSRRTRIAGIDNLLALLFSSPASLSLLLSLLSSSPLALSISPSPSPSRPRSLHLANRAPHRTHRAPRLTHRSRHLAHRTLSVGHNTTPTTTARPECSACSWPLPSLGHYHRRAAAKNQSLSRSCCRCPRFPAPSDGPRRPCAHPDRILDLQHAGRLPQSSRNTVIH